MNKVDIFKIDLQRNQYDKRARLTLPVVYICLIFVTFFAIGLRGADLQINASSDFYKNSYNLSSTKEFIPAQRGLFLDKNKNLLVNNYNDYSLYLYKKEYSDQDYENIKDILQTILNEEEISLYLSRLDTSEYDIKLKENVSYVELNSIMASDDSKFYFYSINTQKRKYLYPEEFSHVIGYTGKTEPGNIKDGYSQFDSIGKYKLELQFEQQLKGVKGATYSIDGSKNTIPSEAGNNIQLTIDKDWQVALYKIIKQYSNQYNSAGGAGVIVDDANGDVIALVSYPGIDTNLFISGITESKFSEYSTDRKLPLIDKSIALQIAPGSTFKLITSYALLENNIVDENTIYFSNRCLEDENFDFCEYQKYFYGQMNVVRALYKSSNLFFCVNSLKLEDQGDLAKLFEAESIFGLGQKTGIDLTGELPGNIDTPEYKKSNFNLEWYSGDTCNAVIGQGSNTVTPIQMALVAQAIANKGTVYKPNLIEKITDSFGNTIEMPEKKILRTIPMSDRTVSLINEGMSMVANYWDGTLYPFLGGLPGNIRAKTGTAEASEFLADGSINNTTHGWIVGSFDYEGKTYSFSSVLNLGGGGFYVGQITRDFINCLYSNFPESCK